MFAREFGWTTDDMDKLYRSEIRVIAAALKNQKLVEEGLEQMDKWAFLAAVITNGFSSLIASISSKRRKPKLVKPEDFLNKDFRKVLKTLLNAGSSTDTLKDLPALIADAKAKGLKGPWSKVGENQ